MFNKFSVIGKVEVFDSKSRETKFERRVSRNVLSATVKIIVTTNSEYECGSRNYIGNAYRRFFPHKFN